MCCAYSFLLCFTWLCRYWVVYSHAYTVYEISHTTCHHTSVLCLTLPSPQIVQVYDLTLHDDDNVCDQLRNELWCAAGTDSADYMLPLATTAEKMIAGKTGA